MAVSLLAPSFLISFVSILDFLLQEFLKLPFAATAPASLPLTWLLYVTVAIVSACSLHDKSDLQARKTTHKQSFDGPKATTLGHSTGGYL